MDSDLGNTDCDNLARGQIRVPEPLGTIVNVIGYVFMIVVLFFSFWPSVNNPQILVYQEEGLER